VNARAILHAVIVARSSALPARRQSKRDPQIGFHERPLVFDLVRRVAIDLQAGTAQAQLLAAIAADLRRGAMIVVAVELHDESLLAPESIDGPPLDDCVDFWHRYSGRFAQRDKRLLERTARQRKTRFVPLERLAQLRASRTTAAEEGPDGLQVEELTVIGLGKCAPNPAKSRDRGVVEEGLSDRGDGEALV
jgi:hypothetical protein